MKKNGFSKPSQPPRKPNNTAKRKMILTNCAACAAPLAHNAPRCVRCHTRYCNATCQHDHWRRGHYASSLLSLDRFEEAKLFLRKTIPVARRVLGETRELTLKMRWAYAMALYGDDDATLDDLREAVTTLEETERTARRVLGGAHPTTGWIEEALRNARAVLRARETPSTSA